MHHSAAREGETRITAPCFHNEIPADIAAVQQAAFGDAALLLAIDQLARRNGYTLRQQVALWRPFA